MPLNLNIIENGGRQMDSWAGDGVGVYYIYFKLKWKDSPTVLSIYMKGCHTLS